MRSSKILNQMHIKGFGQGVVINYIILHPVFQKRKTEMDVESVKVLFCGK